MFLYLNCDDSLPCPNRLADMPGSSNLTRVLLLLIVALTALLIRLAIPKPRVHLTDGLPTFEESSAVSFERVRLGEAAPIPRICHVQILDFDEDGTNDVLVCDATRNGLFLYRREGDGWSEQLIADGLKIPAHAAVVDLDGDGDRDVVVAILGDQLPSDEYVGKVVLLENQNGGYHSRVLLDDVRRVADVQPGDLDGDGDIDLAVAVFGYARGEILWLENREGQFRDHQLQSRPGVIHVPVRDYDGDGDLDLATVVSQDEEEVWGFENQGDGQFTPRRLFYTDNFDAGSGGLVACDLDQDGDSDLLVPWGDNLEYGHGWPQPYHGCMWLENLGDWKFRPQRIATFGGTYAAADGDIDGDGDIDVVLVSMSNNWNEAQHSSVVWLENNGKQEFRTWSLDTSPIELISVACGDLNGDGRADIVAGGFHLPTTGLTSSQRVTAWLSQGSPSDQDDAE